jgi:hypothetical protein
MKKKEIEVAAGTLGRITTETVGLSNPALRADVASLVVDVPSSLGKIVKSSDVDAPIAEK